LTTTLHFEAVMKIVVLDGYTLAADGNSWEALRMLGDVNAARRC
jgi:hypothetical protein